MTASAQVWALQAYTDQLAVDARNAMAALFGAPYASVTKGASITTAAGAHGVIGTNDLAVSQHGTPNMSVDVAAGRCVVRGTEATVQGVYPGHNTASLNVVIAAADATNARKDLIVAKIMDSEYSGATDTFSIVVVAGTPAGSPADPTVPESALVLARVAVAANATSIVTANITDLRTYASAVGGIIRCTSSTRPTGASLGEGLFIYETDTDKVYRYDGTNWVPPKNVSGGTYAYTAVTSDKTTSGGTITIASAGAVTIPASRRLRVTGWTRDVYPSGSTNGNSWALRIKESSTVLAESLLNNYGSANVPMAGGTTVTAILTPSAGSHTYTFVLDNVFATGNATAEGASTYPSFILVEDIGGV